MEKMHTLTKKATEIVRWRQEHASALLRSAFTIENLAGTYSGSLAQFEIAFAANNLVKGKFSLGFHTMTFYGEKKGDAIRV
jgi:hypothetical protein